MTAITTHGLIFACLWFSAAIAAADSPQSTPRTDLYGDPLPDGAIARMGTVRLRHAGLSDFVFIASGKTILSAGNDRVLRFWDIGTGKQTRAVKLQGTAGPSGAATLSPDGKTLVAHDQESLVFWEVESGKKIKSLPWPKDGVCFLYFSPDGKTMAVGKSNWRVNFCDCQSGKDREVTLAVHPNQVVQFNMDSTFHGSFSPDGKWFVAGANWQQPLGVFDVATRDEVLRLDCGAYTSTVSPDGKRLAVSSMRNDKGKSETVLRLFELPSGKKIAEFPQGHEGPYFSLAFSPDGKTLACGASDHGCLVDCTSGRVLHKLPDRPWALAFAPDGKTLVWSESGNRLRLWYVADGKELHDRPGNFGSTTAIAISPDGRLMAAADWMDRGVSLWDTISGRLLRQFPLTGKEDRYVRSLAFSADGRTLVTCQHRGLLRFWDVVSGKERRAAVQLSDPERVDLRFVYFYQLIVTADGRHISTLERILGQGESTRLALWETGTGKLLHQETFPSEIRKGAWSADGKTVALSIENVLKQVEVNTGTVCVQIPGVPNGAITISPDDRLLAAPRKTESGKDEDVAVTVWESATGKEVAKLTTGRVEHLALAPDNRSLVTTYQGFLKVWDLATGKERKHWFLPETSTDFSGTTFASSLHLSPDGRRAFTVLADGTALVWDLASVQPAKPLAKQTTEKEIAAWWADLIDSDAARAYGAVWRLAEAPEAMVIALLRGHLKPAPEPDAKQVRQLIADLDNDAFKVRESAYRQLAELGNAAVPALREALTKNSAPEVQRRLETLLSRPQKRVDSPVLLRRLRAIQVLERLDSQDSRRLLAELAKGAKLANETVEAKRALDRLAHRSRGGEK